MTYREPTYATETMNETLERHGWSPDDGGWKPPAGYGVYATCTLVTAFEIEMDLGEIWRRFPRPRPSLYQRLRSWHYRWKLRRDLRREAIVLQREKEAAELKEALEVLWGQEESEIER